MEALRDTGQCAMSEYQYYEFLAIDRPLDASRIEQLRACSTRARITPTHFVNEYHWGDFRGDVRTFLTRYFDAMIYVANWGTRRFACRLPTDAVDDASALEPYQTPSVVVFDHVKGQILIDLTANDEDSGDEWCEGEGWMASLSPLRAELIAGDWRALYLAWLRAVDQGEIPDKRVEPAVPPGLMQLSPSQQALVRYLDIDQDLLAAAQQASEPGDEPKGAEDWLASLSANDKDRLLRAVWNGEATKVQAELSRRWRQSQSATNKRRSAPRRRVAQLRQLAEERRSKREQAEAQRLARQAAERQAREAAAREARLKSLSQQPTQAWTLVEQWIETRLAENYDQAVARLVDLAELTRRQNDQAAFDQRLTELVRKHARKSTLMTRLARAGLR